MYFADVVFKLVLIALASCNPSPIKSNENFKLVILHNNDIHGRFEQTGLLSDKCSKIDAENNKCFGGFARIATKVKEHREKAKAGEAPNVLFLNAGDTYTGTPWFAIFKEKITADFLNILKPDAMSLGNHEFDQGTRNLSVFMRKLDFPVLAANVLIRDEQNFQSSEPSIIFVIKGRKVGVIGYLTPETKKLVNAVNAEITDEIDALNTEAAKLKARGVNIVIALGHSGYEKDKQIAEDCLDIDLVIGGHSHTFLYTGKAPSVETPEGDYPTTVTQASGKKVPVVQAYAFTKYLGYLHLEFDIEGNLIEIDGTPILLDASVPQDPEVLKLLEKYRPGILEYENDVVGSVKVFLNGSCRQSECNLGNLLTDSMVDWFASLNGKNVSIALLQGGAIRASINPEANNGLITKEDISTVLPFMNQLQIVEVTGKALLEAFEHSVHRYTEIKNIGEFLQMSGARVVYNMSLPIGQRVVEAKVLISDFEPVDESKTYRVAIQDFLANGGDGYDMFKDRAIERLDVHDVDVLLTYLKKISPVNPTVEGRITIII